MSDIEQERAAAWKAERDALWSRIHALERANYQIAAAILANGVAVVVVLLVRDRDRLDGFWDWALALAGAVIGVTFFCGLVGLVGIVLAEWLERARPRWRWRRRRWRRHDARPHDSSPQL